ncbi:MAG: ROK family transcriptional regulator [Candidatus Sulfotelmatobacter sp.]
MKKERVLIGRPPLLRHTNAQVLLKLLRQSGPCSKADLVRASGLSAPTVTNVVAHLASAGLIELIGEGDSTGGRPPDILRFRAERGCVIGVEITSDSVHFLLADLNGQELGRARVDLSSASSTPPNVCSLIATEVRGLLRKHGRAEGQLLGLVVGIPAIVNVNEGSVLSFTALQDWRAVPLGRMLQDKLRCPVIVENDTNLAAQGEYYCGAAQKQENFVFITIGEGVGAGIFLNGRIYRGSQWSAGEIGYLRVPSISREKPAIDASGRLEKVLGAAGILKSWRSASKGSRTLPQVNHAAEVLDLAAAGNAHAKQVLQQRAVILADVVLDMALILNPSVILLGGEVGNHPRLLQEVTSLLEGSEVPVVRIKLGALGSSAVLWGAIYSCLEPAILSLIQPSRLAS